MFSRTRHFIPSVCSKWLSLSASASKVEGFLPLELLRSELVNEEGLFPEKGDPKINKTMFNEEDYAPTKPFCYGCLNFKVEGFDMVVVEKFAQSIHRLVLKQKIKVAEVYALPTEFLTVKHLGDEFTVVSENMRSQATLPIHARVIQTTDLQAVMLPILMQSLANEVPPGIKLSVNEYREEDFMKRHKENKELLEAKADYQRLRYGR